MSNCYFCNKTYGVRQCFVCERFLCQSHIHNKLLKNGARVCKTCLEYYYFFHANKREGI